MSSKKRNTPHIWRYSLTETSEYRSVTLLVLKFGQAKSLLQIHREWHVICDGTEAWVFFRLTSLCKKENKGFKKISAALKRIPRWAYLKQNPSNL